MRVLVTGGAGFVGSHVVDALRARGDDVVALDNLSTGNRDNLDPGVPLIVADVSERDRLHRALGGQQVDAVVHAAAKTKVVESIEQPTVYRRVIIDGTSNTLDVAQALGASRFVNISTGGAIYGETPPSCANEDAPLEAPSPYGRFKAEAESLVERTEGLEGVTLRLANVYGPRQRTDLEGGVIAIFGGCWRRSERLTIFGDGTAERDYVYVTDVAAAILAALDGRVTGPHNIGTGVATSVNRIIEVMTEVLGPPAGVDRLAAREGEIQRNCLDASKAGRALGWRPTVGLREGIRRTVAA